MTGVEDHDAQGHLLNQILRTYWFFEGSGSEDREHAVKSILGVLKGIEPQNTIEGLLAGQMLGTHSAAMECLRRAMIPEQSFEGRDQNLKHAEKLLSIYSQQMDALNRHRGKGQQKITVERVNVERGGQAMVGHIEGGKSKEGEEETSQDSKSTLEHKPGVTIDQDLEVNEPVKPRRKRPSKSQKKT